MIVHSKFILYAVFFKTKFQVILFIVGLLAIWQKGLKVRRIVEILFGKYSLEIIWSCFLLKWWYCCQLWMRSALYLSSQVLKTSKGETPLHFCITCSKAPLSFQRVFKKKKKGQKSHLQPELAKLCLMAAFPYCVSGAREMVLALCPL